MAHSTIEGQLVLSTADILEAVREYVNYHKLAGGNPVQSVAFNGDGNVTARVKFVIVRKLSGE